MHNFSLGPIRSKWGITTITAVYILHVGKGVLKGYCVNLGIKDVKCVLIWL